MPPSSIVDARSSITTVGSIVWGDYRSASLWFTVLPLAVALFAYLSRRHFAVETSSRNRRITG